MTLRRCACVWILAAISGCGVSEVDDALVVATHRNDFERRSWEAIVHSSHAATPIRWLVLAPGDDLARLATRKDPPDLLLDVPVETCERLARAGLLETKGGPGDWKDTAGRTMDAGGVVDPRVDDTSLALSKALLDEGDWSKGYARLIAGERATEHVVAAVALRAARHATAASTLIGELFATRNSVPGAPRHPSASEADDLLADLLGATLVDAHDELIAARRALDDHHHPAKAQAFLNEPPPWPPASVEKLLLTDKDAMPLLETLAAQLAPEADCRGWLLRSWLTPKRLLDGAILGEIATAANGRLVREPRFRAWLRSEWTAWARQRYRRVARLAALPAPPPGG